MTGHAGPGEMLREGLAQLAVPSPDAAQRALDGYLDELERWNPRFGLVKAASREELIVKHVLDSLSAWTLVRDETRGGGVLDVGSGAGLPGIPLAIALPQTSFTLLERSARKASFLKNCRTLLDLRHVEVVLGGLDSVNAVFDVVTFRAVAPLSRFLADASSSRPGFRTLIAYKGRVERARREIEEVERSTGAPVHAEVIPLTVPFLAEERCAVIVRHFSTLP